MGDFRDDIPDEAFDELEERKENSRQLEDLEFEELLREFQSACIHYGACQARGQVDRSNEGELEVLKALLEARYNDEEPVF